MDSNERPWISIKEISRLDRNSDGETLFSIVEKNSGKTPNFGIDTQIDIVPHDGWPEAVMSFCKTHAELREEQKKNRFEVIPDGTFQTYAKGTIHPRISNAHVIGCITYEWHGKPHHTGFVAAMFFDPKTNQPCECKILYAYNVNSD